MNIVHLKSPVSKQRAARRKQIEIGKKTQGYINYTNLIPKLCLKINKLKFLQFLLN